MRINVYHEELTTETVFVETVAKGTGKTYYGVRMFMKSAPELHHVPDDDDRTAITFWWGTKRAALRHLELITESLRNDLNVHE